MKSNQKKALHQKNLQELKQELSELEKELVKSRLALAAQKLEDTSKPKRLAKDVACFKTIITEKEAAEATKTESSTNKKEKSTSQSK